MIAVAAIWLLADLAPVATIHSGTTLELASRDVRVGDVADLSRLDPALRRRLATRVVARVPSGRSRMTVSRAALARLVQRAVPSLQVEGSETPIEVRVALAPLGRAPVPCFALLRAVRADEPLTMEDVGQVACGGDKAAAPVRYQRRGSVARAAAALPEGSYLGRVALPAEKGVDRGEALTLASRVGPVTVERSVVSLQPGRPGRRLFVRDEEGHVIAAAVADGKQGGER
jgi:flagella basal body P-ring formation protein FlgA